jgi:very-short-patch-repair endonuclease
MIPHNHISKGYGCPECGKKYGKSENQWMDSISILKEFRQYRIDKYIVDGYDPTTKTVYEFNGDFWHGNPNIYNESDINIVCKKSFGELHKRTIDNKCSLENMGYKVVSIWESDYKKSHTDER